MFKLASKKNLHTNYKFNVYNNTLKNTNYLTVIDRMKTLLISPIVIKTITLPILNLIYIEASTHYFGT